jgi:streptogramin lyase
MALTPAGWYPDPSGAARLRYFDGTHWTDYFNDPGPSQGVHSEGQPTTIPTAPSSQAVATPVKEAAVPFGASGADKGATTQRHPAVRALVFLILAIAGFSMAVAGFVKLMYSGGSEIYTVGALLFVLVGDIGAVITANVRAAKPAVRRLLMFLILAIVGYLMAVAGFVVQVELSYSIGDGIKSVGVLLFIIGIVGAIVSAIVRAAKPSPARQIYSPIDQRGGPAPVWYPDPQATDTVCLPTEPPSAPSARRNRAPWIIAVAVVAVLAFALATYELRSRQVVLPFTGLNDPRGVAVDTTGAVYVADSGNNRVLKMPAGTTTPTTLSFTGLNKPSAVAVDTTGAVYVADSGNNRVLKMPAGTTTPTTLPFTGLTDPEGVAVDSAGAVYVVASVPDVGGARGQVLKLAADASTPTTVPFTLTVSAVGGPTGVAVDTAGTVYVADGSVRRLTAGATTPDTLPFTFSSPGGAWGVAVDTAGTVYITDPYWQRVVKLAAGSTTQDVLAFTGLGQPHGVAVDTAGTVYVTDDSNHVVKLPPH